MRPPRLRSRLLSSAQPWSLLVFVLVLVPADGAEAPPARRAFLDRHCASCHNSTDKKGGLDLSQFDADLRRRDALAAWVRLHDRVANGEMPPPQRPSPAVPEKRDFLAALAADLTQADRARRGTILRRLNRLEYQNTLHDLLDIRADLVELLPEDGKAHGFDTVGEALDLSGVQLQRYLEAAGRALDAAVRKGPQPESTTQTHGIADGRNAAHLDKHWLKRDDGTIVSFGNGGYPRLWPEGLRITADGRYRVRLGGYAFQSKEPVTFAVYAGPPFRDSHSRLLGYRALAPGPIQHLEWVVELQRGEALRVMPQGLSNYQVTKIGPEKYDGPGLALAPIRVEGPLPADWPGRGHRLLYGNLPIEPTRSPTPRGRGPVGEIRSANPDADAERLLTGFASAAFRRPVTAEKVAPYLRLFRSELADGAGFEQALRTAYVALLCAPDFLYLVEGPGKLDGHALAARLSYFLGRSAPDAELLAAAARGDLARPDLLRNQTERLLKDPKAARFVADFVGQWLNLRDINFTTPDERLYPEFDDWLRESMVEETERFFAEILRAERPLTDFLHSDWSMLNERLARHYGIEGVRGPEFRRVALRPEHHRGGVLAHGSVLKVSANGTTTSPVMRGAWVLERLLNEPPPPPPPGVPGVEPDVRGATTLREQLAKHRTLASCSGCHRVIDPPGFALENYDVIGGWRERYRITGQTRSPADMLTLPIGQITRRVALGPRVDAAGETVDGKAFTGPDDYKRLLLADPERFARALTEKLAVFATGRGLGFSDRPAVAEVVHANAAAGRSFRDLVHRLVQSPIFQTK